MSASGPLGSLVLSFAILFSWPRSWKGLQSSVRQVSV